MRKYKTDRRYPNQYGFYNRTKNRPLAGDPSFWYKERQGACISGLTLLKIEQHRIPTSLSSDIFNLRWPHNVKALLVTPNGLYPQ